MSRDTEGDSGLWIRPHDELGEPIDARLLVAANRAWKRVRSYAQLQGQDRATAASDRDVFAVLRRVHRVLQAGAIPQ